MTLQTSGAISLNQIHVEAGGTSGTSVSLNDSDVRRLKDGSSGVSSTFSSFYNRTRYVVTCATGTSGSTSITGYKSSSPTAGSRSPTSLTWTSATWTGLYYNLNSPNANTYQLLLGGSGSGTNSGFTTMGLGASQNFSRTSASFSGSSSTFSVWRWSSASNLLTNGSVRDVYFY
jgi:hypothetical protein